MPCRARICRGNYDQFINLLGRAKVSVDIPAGIRYNNIVVLHNESPFKGGIWMSEIRVKDNESLDSALRRFKRSCARSGVLAEVRKREHYEKPSVKRKKKSEAARKRKYK